jgi:hypothetical protein
LEWDQLGVFGGEEEEGGVSSGPGVARTILLFHIISARPSKQPVCDVPLTLALYVYMLGNSSWRATTMFCRSSRSYASSVREDYLAIQGAQGLPQVILSLELRTPAQEHADTVDHQVHVVGQGGLRRLVQSCTVIVLLHPCA